MAVAQVGSLVSFTAGTTMVSADVNSNFTDLRTAFNNLVTGSNTLAGSIAVGGALTVNSGGLTVTAGGLTVTAGSLVATAAGPHATGASTLDYTAVYLAGAFTSLGASTNAVGLRVAHTLTGASGDTGLLAGMYLSSSIVTQSVAETVTEVCQLRLDEPTITKNVTTITNADTLLIMAAPTEGATNNALRVASGSSSFQALTATTITGSGVLSIDDTTDSTSGTSGSVHTDGGLGVAKALYVGTSLTVAGTGPSVIGGAAVDYIGLFVRGAFTSLGASNSAVGVRVAQTVTGASGDTGLLAGTYLSSAVTTQTVAEVVDVVCQLRVDEPDITKNVTTITTAASLYVKSAPDEGATNYAIWVQSGTTGLQAVTATTVTTSGALWVGTTTRLVGAVTCDAVVSVDDETDTTGATDGSFHTDGGVGIAKKLYVAGVATLAGGVIISDNISRVGGTTTDTDSPEDTSENTLVTVTVPADAMGTNGGIRVWAHGTVTGTNAQKDVRLEFGGTQIAVISFASGETGQFNFLFHCYNRNSASAQIWTGIQHEVGVATLTQATGTKDTTGALDVTITAQTANATDEITLYLAVVELIKD